MMRLWVMGPLVVASLAVASSVGAANPQKAEFEKYLASASWTRQASPVAVTLAEGINDWLSFGDGPFLARVKRDCPTLRRLAFNRGEAPAGLRAAHQRLIRAYVKIRSACSGAERQADSVRAPLIRLLKKRSQPGDFEREFRKVLSKQRTALARFEEQNVEPFLRTLVRWRIAVISYGTQIADSLPWPRWIADVGRRCSTC